MLKLKMKYDYDKSLIEVLKYAGIKSRVTNFKTTAFDNERISQEINSKRLDKLFEEWEWNCD